jgi:ABC-2 type transport system permease protein
VSDAVPFTALLRSEWTKLRTLRSTWWCLAVYVVLALGLGWLAAAVTQSAPDAGLAVAAALTGFGFGQLVLVVLGVLVGATEFTSGSAVASFTGVPRRSRLLLAKTVVVGVGAAVVSAVLAVGCAVAARTLTDVSDGGIGFTDPAVLRPLGLQVAVAVAVVVLSVALGTLLRSTAGGVGVGFAMVLVAPPLLAADGRRLPERIADLLPALRVGEDPFLAGPATWTAGVAVVAAWAVGAWLLSAVVLERRDV